MLLICKLLFRKNLLSGWNRQIRGLSTAELVGIVIIVGTLSALAGTYVSGLVGQAKTNEGNQNAQNLNIVIMSAFAGGAIVDDGTHSPGMLDISTGAAAVTQLCGAGVTVTSNGNTINYKVSPPGLTAASYTLAGAGGNDPSVLKFTYTPASGAGP